MNNYNNRGGSDRGGFKGGDRGARGGASDFKKRSFGNDRGGDRDTTFFKATCADCKKMCEVPFRPNGEKPVFCRDCFGAKKGDEGRFGERREDSRFEKRAPAHTWSDRSPSTPAYAKPDTKPQISEEMKRQMSDILYKLDKLTHLVERLSEEKTSTSKTVEEKIEEVAPKKRVSAKKKAEAKAE